MSFQQSKIKIIALPYAGGNKYSYKGLQSKLDGRFQLITIELPGRGARIAEPLLTNVQSIIEDLLIQIRPHLNTPFIIYGHSMGGLLGNLLIQQLNAKGLPLPLLFMASGCSGPQASNYSKNRHKLPDTALIKELEKLGGFPNEVLKSKELMAFILPILRADFQALDCYQYQKKAPYNVPIYALAGTTEAITDKQLEAWLAETSQTCTYRRLPGNHFFILQHFDKLAKIIQQELSSAVLKAEVY